VLQQFKLLLARQKLQLTTELAADGRQLHADVLLLPAD
jgi:hypothetical protein